MILAPDAHNNPTYPIWDGLKVVNSRHTVEQNIPDDSSRFYSSRAGDPILLMPTGALDDDQNPLTIGQKVT